MTLRIALIADLHFASADSLEPAAERQRPVADTLLLRAVRRLKRWIRPDVVCVAGDLVDRPEAPGVEEDLAALRATLDLLDCPWIALPGNHDLPRERFEAVMGPTPPFLDVAGTRILTFVDPEEPEFNARRKPRDIARFAEARAAFDGPVAALQHVPLFPPGTSDCPHHYVNAAEIIEAMRRERVGLSLSGHFHAGVEPLRNETTSFFTASALCEAPFRFFVVEWDGREMRVEPHALRLPDGLPPLVDRHVHTPFAYCNENMDVAKTLHLAGLFGLAGLSFAEHADHLLFSREDQNAAAYVEKGVALARPEDDRVDAYFETLARFGVAPEARGLEISADYAGRPIARAEDMRRAGRRIGALHELRAVEATPRPDLDAAAADFLRTLETFLGCGVEVLAHPFRVFRRAGLPTPTRLFAPTADLLRKHGVAAELNFHCNEPPEEFVRACLERGVALSLGSDSHNLCEVGELEPQILLLQRCAEGGDWGAALWSPPPGPVSR